MFSRIAQKVARRGWRKYSAGSKTLYHVGFDKPFPVPSSRSVYPHEVWDRPWLDEPVESGVFLTPNPVAVWASDNMYGAKGDPNVYVYVVPWWVIDESGGIHRHVDWSEVLIPEELWEHVDFKGKMKESEWQHMRYEFRDEPINRSSPEEDFIDWREFYKAQSTEQALAVLSDQELKDLLQQLDSVRSQPAQELKVLVEMKLRNRRNFRPSKQASTLANIRLLREPEDGSASANQRGSVIRVYDRFFGHSQDIQRHVLSHELGHWHREHYVSLVDIFGVEYGEGFYGVYGMPDSEEGYAEAFAAYLNSPSELRDQHSHAFEFLDDIIVNPSSYRSWVDSALRVLDGGLPYGKEKSLG